MQASTDSKVLLLGGPRDASLLACQGMPNHHALLTIATLAPSTNRLALDWLRHNVPQGPVLFHNRPPNGGPRPTLAEGEFRGGQDVHELGHARAAGLAIHMNMCVSLAVRDALTQHLPPSQSNGAVMVKWPNASSFGMVESTPSRRHLVENVWRGSQWAVAVIGIGVNVNSRADAELPLSACPKHGTSNSI